MNYFSMFSGIGGFELGIERAFYNRNILSQQTHKNLHPLPNFEVGQNGATCVGYSEIDKYAIQVYESHFNHRNYGDATAIVPSDLPDFNLLVGGFPCQAFSVAGKRRGLDDARGTLFYDIARIAQEKKPKHLLLENVKGLLSHDGGRTFKRIVTTFTELGYDLEWQVLNSKDFGVPQNRERMFIIGHLGACCRREVLPIRPSDKETPRVRVADYDSRGDSRNSESQNGRSAERREISVGRINLGKFCHTKDESLCITANYGKGLDNHGQRTCIAVLTPDRPEKRQNGRRFKEDGEPAFTLTAQDKHGIYDGARIRRLTPLECERLQGFPDDWTKGISDTQRYKTVGNAVTVNVIERLIEKLCM